MQLDHVMMQLRWQPPSFTVWATSFAVHGVGFESCFCLSSSHSKRGNDDTREMEGTQLPCSDDWVRGFMIRLLVTKWVGQLAIRSTYYSSISSMRKICSRVVHSIREFLFLQMKKKKGTTLLKEQLDRNDRTMSELVTIYLFCDFENGGHGQSAIPARKCGGS